METTISRHVKPFRGVGLVVLGVEFTSVWNCGLSIYPGALTNTRSAEGLHNKLSNLKRVQEIPTSMVMMAMMNTSSQPRSRFGSVEVPGQTPNPRP